MVKTFEDGSSVPPFLLKCYEMVDDESTDSLISWSESYSNSFIIWDVPKFQSELLPKYFKHSNFSSFIRQLNIYGFRKTDTDRWEFSNDEFVKGQKHLLKNIIRRKQSQGQGQSQRKSSSRQKETESPVSEEHKRIALSKEVESLKTDKNALMQELGKLRQKQQSSQSKMLVLREQMKGMEKNQQQMLSFIVMAMQNPGFFVQLLQPKESNWRPAETGKNVISRVADDVESEPVSSDKLIVRYQLPMGEASEPPCSAPSSNSEMSMEWDISDEMRDLLMNIDFTPGPSDEKLLPFENHEPVVLSDIPDGDFMLEQLLLSSPIKENMVSDELDSETATYHGIQQELAFQAQESDDLGVEKNVDTSANMDFLTAQMDSRLKC
ncbi:hypothetical protein M9H77_09063 [Catharanthus roseus]|uniref:Uncharacterized protein n=1 Tax=Catharanthus roseus TaxID=4058 RepID=A0ACC0BZI3_CATRO|nr:hypothetical protein M9H77_09063 [Catharanthus roseus]